jgi:predicted HicB family RNase H-like nuclease
MSATEERAERPRKKNNSAISVMMPLSLHHRLRAAAWARDLSMNQYVRHAVTLQLERDEQPPLETR